MNGGWDIDAWANTQISIPKNSNLSTSQAVQSLTNNVNDNVMRNEYNNDPQITAIRTVEKVDEMASDAGLLAFAAGATGQVEIATPLGAAALALTALKHQLKGELGKFNGAEAIVDFVAPPLVGKTGKAMSDEYGDVISEGANQLLGNIVGTASEGNKNYEIPKETDTQAYKNLMNYFNNKPKNDGGEK